MADSSATAAMEAELKLDASRLADPAPHGRLLSNGRYTAFVTNAGTGFSRLGEIMLTRWNGDRTEDAQGWFVYVRDRDTGAVSSFGYHPITTEAAGCAATFGEGQVCLTRTAGDLDLRMEVAVAPDADVEFRRCTLSNRGARSLRADLTSCLDVVLNTRAADVSHPAFSKLFVQTAYVAEHRALLAQRRPRAAGEDAGCMVHWLIVEGGPGPGGPALEGSALAYETDRFAFIGRGRGFPDPQALDPGSSLSRTVGNVLDPVLSLRLDIDLAPGESRTVTFALAAAESRDGALDLCRGHGSAAAMEEAFAGARRRHRALARRLGIGMADVNAVEAMATDLLYRTPRRRKGARGQGGAKDGMRVGSPGVDRLADLGLGGARPFVLVDTDREEGGERLRRALRARAWWSEHGLSADVIILSATGAAGESAYHDALAASPGLSSGEGVTILGRDGIAPGDETLVTTLAGLVLGDGRDAGPEVERTMFADAPGALDPIARRARGLPGDAAAEGELEPLLFDNGHGGFSADGFEYVIRVAGGAGRSLPPLPWTHVVANEGFGFLVSETGAACTWAVNSRLNRLTPWSNDPVTDPHGEALYLRDEAAGTYWSPMPGPVGDGSPYTVRYGFGFCTFVHHGSGLHQEVVQFVAQEDPVKITQIHLRNDTDRPRSLSVFVYYRLVLGDDPAATAPLIWTRIDPDLRAALAGNPLREDFAGRVAFAAVAEPDLAAACSFTTDRAAFVGRNGCPARPAAVLGQAGLDGQDGRDLDPCFAIHIPLRLGPGETTTCTLLLGEADDETAARAVIERYREPGAAHRSLDAVRAHWRGLVAPVQVRTPAPALDLMVNGWLLYQNLSCRIHGRSAFYQSGGAFGFRDQLQDAAALVHTVPELTRRQILLHAAHQFVEGDVMHWWHPPHSRGMRTRFSDDLLWLAFVTLSYMEATGDRAILDEMVPFMRARALEPGEDETYLRPEVADDTASLYEHCCRALDRSLTQGAHGLPLMGTGDWNDGMNRVGREGRGESVWLGFFLCFILTRFVPVCRQRGDTDRADAYEAYTEHLTIALNDTGWDGGWYRRAYYDDGTPLGTAEGDECRIDALVQAWAVISGVAPPERVEQALDALDRHLVSEADGLIRLLTPPFDRTPHDPGYIKGYVAGVRENGGQYTHAALWVVRALAEAGRRDRAATLLEMISPVSHGASAEAVARYKVEPYVVAADVYGAEPHVGRGGWTWYTGSAAWMYRVALESLLGVTTEGGTTLIIAPRLPAAWPEAEVIWSLPDGAVFAITLRHGGERRSQVLAATVDGAPAEIRDGAARIPLGRDARRHDVVVDLT